MKSRKDRKEQDALDRQLLVAVMGNNEEQVAAAIQAGANVNYVEYATNHNPLMIAACEGYAAIVGMLLDGGAKHGGVSSHGSISYPMYFAIENGHDDVVSAMVDRAFNKPELNIYFYHKMTPLKEAARHGRVAMVKLLLEHGARHDYGYDRSGGSSALSYAAKAKANGLTVAEALVEAGASVNSIEVCGETPLHVAADHGALDVVRFLVSKGANIDAKDEFGNTPAHKAVSNGHADVVVILKEAQEEQAKAAKQVKRGYNSNAIFKASHAIVGNDRQVQDALLAEIMRDRPEQVVAQMRAMDDEFVAKLLFAVELKSSMGNGK